MNKSEFIFPAVMILFILGIPIGIVLWANHAFL